MTSDDPSDALSTGLYDQPVLILDPGVHTAPIKRADVDAAGATVVTGSDDRTVRVWSARTGELLRTIRLPRGPGDIGRVYAVAISPDGELVAAGGWTRTSDTDRQEQVYVFEVATGMLVRRIEGLPEVVIHLAFSPDGRYLAATMASINGLCVYDRDAGWEEIARDQDYGDHSFGAAFAADGRLATTSCDGQLRLYDSAFRRVAMSRCEGGEQPYGIAFNPEGDRLAVGFFHDTGVSLFDGHDLSSRGGADTSGISNGDLSKVAWSDDGATLYAGGLYWGRGNRSIVAWSDAGTGTRSELLGSLNTIMSLRPLPEGGLLVASQDPYLAVFDANGTPRWEHKPQQAEFMNQQRIVMVSADGGIVDFGYEYEDRAGARYDIANHRLSVPIPRDGQTVLPQRTNLSVRYWQDTNQPMLDGKPLPLKRTDISRSLAIHPDGKRFVLGTAWYLHAFDAHGEELWRRAAPGEVWAVNITADGRLVVAANGDGTIRWYRMDEGRELFAFFPYIDRTNWVAWTPEGFYAATPGGHGVLRWHINHGWDEPPEAIPISEIRDSRRPEVLPLVLQEMETVRALGLAELQAHRRAVQVRTRSNVAPGARLHVLAMGVSLYGEQAQRLRLSFADQDAEDIATALANTQASLYAEVSPQLLRNEEVTRAEIFVALGVLRRKMAQGVPSQDLAVVLFSGHGRMVDGGFYLLPHGVDTSTTEAIKATALSMEAFRDELHKLGEYGRVLVLLDACRSGAATSDGTQLPLNADAVRLALARNNVTVLTSSSATESSYEDKRWRNGAFTEVFLEALQHSDSDKDGLISVTDLTRYLTTNVPRLTENKQTPGVAIHFESDIFVTGL